MMRFRLMKGKVITDANLVMLEITGSPMYANPYWPAKHTMTGSAVDVVKNNCLKLRRDVFKYLHT